MTILDTSHLKDDAGERKIFLGTYSGFQRYDIYKYKFAKQIESKMRNAFWNPEEISLIGDRSKFPDLPEFIQEILTLNLLFQTVMVSTQSCGLDSILCNLTTSPTNKPWSIHSLLSPPTVSAVHDFKSVTTCSLPDWGSLAYLL